MRVFFACEAKTLEIFEDFALSCFFHEFFIFLCLFFLLSFSSFFSSFCLLHVFLFFFFAWFSSFFFCFSFFFFGFFFFSFLFIFRRPSTRQNRKTTCRKVPSVKMTIFLCGNLIFGPSVNKVFFHFFLFHFSIFSFFQKKFLLFFFVGSSVSF